MLAKRKSVPPRKICKGVKIMDRYRHKEQKVRFTEDEYNYILSKMADSRIKKFQHFALMMLIQGEVSFTDYTELKQLVYEVRKIGTNINQVVRLANQFEDISETDVRDLTKALTKLTDLVESELHKQEDKFKMKKVD
jgi:hypothetical protein